MNKGNAQKTATINVFGSLKAQWENCKECGRVGCAYDNTVRSEKKSATAVPGKGDAQGAPRKNPLGLSGVYFFWCVFYRDEIKKKYTPHHPGVASMPRE